MAIDVRQRGADSTNMSHNAVVLSTINFEELPLHFEHHSIQSLRPSSIEDEDDPRSLLYLFDDNDFERAAAFLAIEEARRQAQARAEALAEAEAQQRRLLQQQRARALAARLEQLLEEDEELIDMLGRRILATRGYQVPDLWRPQHYHHFYQSHGPQYYHGTASDIYGSQYASTSPPIAASTPRRPRASDIHTAWDDFEDHASLSDCARAGPFIHSAPLILQGHAPYPPRLTQPSALASTPPHGQLDASISDVPNHPYTRISIHPLTGVPMLLVEEDTEAERPLQAVQASSSKDFEPGDAGSESDDEADDWPIEDESDLDWLGRELLRRQGGANVWILGTDDGKGKNAQQPQSKSKSQETAQKTLPTVSEPTTSNPLSTASAVAAGLAQTTSSTTPTLPVEVEEVDSDHELAGATSALDTSRDDGACIFSNPSQRVAAALARAASDRHHSSIASNTEAGGSAKRSSRQRAATVMSESEEEDLETVGIPVSDDKDGKGDDASSLNDRPRKSVKVVDLR